MVVVWMMANAVLAMAMSEIYHDKSVGNNAYVTFILWAVASLALFRALGSLTYLATHFFAMIVEGRVKMSLKVPVWMGGFGEKMSEKMSDTMSSVISSVKR